ncbi:hypothetical protein BS329_38755 [Amycolatopsis coloradensis]|uniref:IrrE N-terminal-like domain-containing protein n=1 Tax=Amycolatopsis coloradensis TaxID=76021 RepID=A0A1R0KEQ1_9PSEU|nr:hypothetical protein BS329_38755 [Amycolatopsis coloradensis]
MRPPVHVLSGSTASEAPLHTSQRRPCLALAALGLPPMYSLDVLIGAVADRVDRRIEVRAADLDGALPCGMAVATPDRYFIVYPRTSTVHHRTHIIVHELGHILLEHHKALPDSVDDMVREYAPILAPHLSSDLIRRLLGRTVYDNDHEREAEDFAGAVMDQIGHLADYWAQPREDPAVNRLRILFGGTAR